MKKLSQINEGMWKSAVERAKSNEVRAEDKLHTNIDKMKPIDVGLSFYFADIDLEINGETKFEWDEIKDYLDKLGDKLDGWRLPHADEMMRYVDKTACTFVVDYDDDGYYTATDKTKYGELLVFGPCLRDAEMSFWLDMPTREKKYAINDLNSKYRNTLSLGIRIIKGQWTNPSFGYKSKDNKLRVRLVKSKKRFENR